MQLFGGGLVESPARRIDIQEELYFILPGMCGRINYEVVFDAPAKMNFQGKYSAPSLV